MQNLKRIVKWLWQAPQHILGFTLSRFCKASTDYKERPVYYMDKFFHSAVSLGQYRIFDERIRGYVDIWDHEYGHSLQSEILGPLYLLVIGVPSLYGNLWDRLFHQDWPYLRRRIWYYSQPWEKWADELGNVER